MTTIEQARSMVEADEQLSKVRKTEIDLKDHIERNRNEATDMRSKSEYASAVAHTFGDRLSQDIASAFGMSRVELVHEIEDFIAERMRTKRETLQLRLKEMEEGKFK